MARDLLVLLQVSWHSRYYPSSCRVSISNPKSKVFDIKSQVKSFEKILTSLHVGSKMQVDKSLADVASRRRGRHTPLRGQARTQTTVPTSGESACKRKANLEGKEIYMSMPEPCPLPKPPLKPCLHRPPFSFPIKPLLQKP
jgi:hypothetical protein